MSIAAESDRGAERADTNSRGRPHEVKLARRIARQLEADILASGAPVGQVYASETDLRLRYDASRAVIREAIRLVEHHGLAEMRRGPNGGLVLRGPDGRALTRAVVIYLEYVGTTVEDLLAARMLLEPHAARLAAQAVGEDGVIAIRRALAAEHAAMSPEAMGRELLHTLLGMISGNQVMGLFIDVLVQLTTTYARSPASSGASEFPFSAADDAHDRIAEAVIGGDSARAEHYAMRHLEAMKRWFLGARQEPIGQRVTPADAVVTAHGPREKLAESVARTLTAEIIARQLQPGDVYGSEAELLASLEVSRAVFREAVRLLEYHSIARMRRGPNGGLVVTEPDPSASIEAMAVYLDYERVGADKLLEVRNIIEMGAVRGVVARLDEPGMRDSLIAAHKVDDETPADQFRRLSHSFHIRLVELAGNPVLTLFLRIVVTLFERHAARPPGENSGTAALARSVGHTHGRILEAILDADVPLALHRMKRHLEDIDSWWK